MIYWAIFVIIFISALFYDMFGYSLKKKEVYLYIVFSLIALAAFRYRVGSDTLIYADEFTKFKSFNQIHDITYFFSINGRMFGWVFLNVFIKSFFCNFIVLQLFCALIVNLIICRFIYKNTNYVFTVLLFYYVALYLFLNFEVMRQSLSVALFLLFYEYRIKRKFVLCFLLAVFAFSFHESFLVCFLYIFFLLLPIGKKFLLLWFVLCTLTLFFKDILFNNIVNMFFQTDNSNDKILIYLQDGLQYQDGFPIYNLLNIVLNLIVPAFFIYKNLSLPIVKPLLAYSSCYVFISIIPIVYRFNYFYMIFFFISIVNVFYVLSMKFRQQKIVFFLLVLCFVYVKCRIYFVQDPNNNVCNYVKYYPYSSVFDYTIDREREKIFSSNNM